MKRRKFINSAAAASILPLTLTNSIASAQANAAAEKEIYELRTYEIKFRGNQKLLLNFLNEAYLPALKRKGVKHTFMFREIGMSDPAKLWLLVSYPDSATYIKAQNLADDAEYQSKSADYHKIGPDQRIFNRYSSSLLLAFDGMPQLQKPKDDASIFELRIYEGYSEDAVRRKIKMFNVEEIDLFNRTGLYPVIFGDMISGPYRPALVYMLNFKDMAERDANWKVFFDHPEWKAMLAKKEYANTVSNIRRIFLKPA